MSDQPSPRASRFGEFELDTAAYELRRRGRRVRLERLAMDLLILLVDQRDQLVTRAEIVDRLWGRNVFLEVDASVNTLIRKIRRALGDSVDHPKFIQTVQGKGYRFIAPVEIATTIVAAPPATEGAATKADPMRRSDDGSIPRESPELTAPSSADPPVTVAVAERRRWRVTHVALGIIVLTVVAVTGWLARGKLVRADVAPVRLAIMPIENLTNDPEREYLADGLTEESGASLGQIVDPERVTVVGRMATRRYKGSTKSPAEIGRELSVDYLVVGTLLAEGGRLRVASHMIRVSDQAQLWPRSYDPDDPGDRFAVQQELGTRIAALVGTQLSPERLGGLAQRQTANAGAYDLYLRGRDLGNRLTPAMTQRALEAYGRATLLDPDYPLPWSGIADALSQGTMSGDLEPMKVRDRATAAAERAIKAGAMLPEAQTSLGIQQFFLGWDWRRAEAAFREALRIDPRHAMAHRVLGVVLSHGNRHAEARSELQRARELEPGYAMNYALSALVEFHARDFGAALSYAQRGLELNPEFWVARYQLAQAREQLGQSELALQDLAIGAGLSNNNSKALSMRGYILAKTGKPAEARAVLQQLDEASGKRYVPPYARALVLAGLGDRDSAFEWLEKALAVRDVHLVFLPVDPKWDAFRSDPRFQDILRRCAFTAGRSSP
jgi:TolB-like protein/DNA-binding winged helix-turn-helix (wHTH) protein/tetratricopeptide (TPR) repeat protein